jgi:exopolysaccharide biosynthesis polyprenyl glycosylphosphotransferase
MMIENKISLSPTLKLSSAGQISVSRSLRQVGSGLASKITPLAFLVFASLVASYFLASSSYETLVAPYRDPWPKDFRLISVLLIMSPAVLLLARGMVGDKAGGTRRSALLMLFSANLLFVALISFRFCWEAPSLSMTEFGPLLWVGVWLLAPFVVLEIHRVSVVAVAGGGHIQVVLLATPASITYLSRDEGIASVMGRSFDSRNIYGLGAAAAFADVAVRGDFNHLADAVSRHGLKKIVLASLKSETGLIETAARNLMPLAIDVYSYAIDEQRDASENEFKLVLRRPLSRAGLALKGLEDFCLGAVLTFFFAPLMGFIALAIKLDSPGPVFFKQKRHGYRHREIEVFKFRTMRTDNLDYGCAQQTRRGDPRITRVGSFLRKSSLDELPQLINVIRGEMSLVGPRPHAVTMRTERKLSHEIVPHYANRHCVKPGITGWAQVNGCRGAMDVEDDLVNRVKYDMEYIARWSVVFDFYILFKTIFHLAGTKNAY